MYFFQILLVFLNVCNVYQTEQVSQSTHVDRQKPGAGLTTELYICIYVYSVMIVAHTSVVSWPKLHCTHCQYTLYTVHCITIVLLNYTISGKIENDYYYY